MRFDVKIDECKKRRITNSKLLLGKIVQWLVICHYSFKTIVFHHIINSNYLSQNPIIEFGEFSLSNKRITDMHFKEVEDIIVLS